MAKLFTDDGKWSDPWFRTLSPARKFAWLYLLDNCDHAGVLDLDKPLADFQVGMALDWDGLVCASDNRVVVLSNGNLLATGYIAFQWGKLNESHNPHKAVFRALEKHGLVDWVVDGVLTLPKETGDPTQKRPEGSDASLGSIMVKDQDKAKGMEGGVGETKPAKSPVDQIPPSFPLPLREATATWLKYKSEKRQSYKASGLASLFKQIARVAKDSGESVAINRIENSIAQGHDGWNYPTPDERGRGSPPSRIHVGPGQIYTPSASTSDEF